MIFFVWSMILPCKVWKHEIVTQIFSGRLMDSSIRHRGWEETRSVPIFYIEILRCAKNRQPRYKWVCMRKAYIHRSVHMDSLTPITWQKDWFLSNINMIKCKHPFVHGMKHINIFLLLAKEKWLDKSMRHKNLGYYTKI